MSEGLEAIFFLSFSFFLVGSVGDVSTVLLACVLHALGTNPAAVRGFRNRFPKPNFEMMSARFQPSVPGYSIELFLAMSEGLEAIFFLSFSFFLVESVGDVSSTNPAAVRGFRNRFPKPNFELLSERFQTSVPGYSRIVSCDVGRPGGYLFSFLFFLFSGFRRRRFESFIGLCFACLGHESLASFPLRCLLIGSAPRFRPFFFVTSSSPIVQWEFRMGVSEFSSSIMCFVLVEGGR